MRPNFVVQVRAQDGALIQQRMFHDEQRLWGFIESKRVKGQVVQFFNLAEYSCSDQGARVSTMTSSPKVRSNRSSWRGLRRTSARPLSRPPRRRPRAISPCSHTHR